MGKNLVPRQPRRLQHRTSRRDLRRQEEPIPLEVIDIEATDTPPRRHPRGNGGAFIFAILFGITLATPLLGPMYEEWLRLDEWKDWETIKENHVFIFWGLAMIGGLIYAILIARGKAD